MASESLYLRVKRDIAARIESGAWPPGTYIPSEPDLQQRYRVSRTTVRKAVDELVGDGLLTVIHGMGTRVVAQRLSLRPATLMSFTQMMLAQGIVPGRTSESLTVETAQAEVAAALGIPEDADVVCFRRVRTADGTPVSSNSSYLPLDLFAGYDLDQLLAGQSLYAQLEQAFNLIVQTTEDTFGIARADSRLAADLEVKVGEPLLIIARHGFDKADRPIEYSRIAIRPDRYRHSVTLRRK
ncbi:MAG: GntR family transcriptional regulator [Propionibacteriaceae bacterium]|jgi:GntR family transcriptional regulator|nr:GntR family transcriptional regulator [Propionibacteriaceae bacterium]